MTKTTFKAGDRVKLTRTILDDTTDVHPVHLYFGDLGTVTATNRALGVAFDRYNGDVIAVTRVIEGTRMNIIDLCEEVDNG